MSDPLHAMQGVRSSSLLGSILENTFLDRVFGGHLTAFFVPFCSLEHFLEQWLREIVGATLMA